MASYKKLKSGWQFRISFYMGGIRKTKSMNGFRTKSEAQNAAAELEQQLSRGNSLSAGDMPFIQYFNNWYTLFRKGKLSWKNDRDIEISISTAERFFKSTKLKDIDRHLYQEFLNDYGATHATATVKKIHTYARACLQDALNDGVIFKDPTYRVKVVGQVKNKDESLKFLHENELLKLSNNMQDNLNPRYPSRYMILFGIATGCRFSEVVGLTWDCVDFKQQTIKINKTFDYQKTLDFLPTKNDGSMRTISVDPFTLDFLKELLVYQQTKLKKKNTKNLVFIDANATINTNTAVNKVLKATCAELEINPITFHALRHTHASILLYREINIKYVSRRLGHTDIVTTLQTYGHILDELEQRESSKVDQVMDNLYQQTRELECTDNVPKISKQ